MKIITIINTAVLILLLLASGGQGYFNYRAYNEVKQINTRLEQHADEIHKVNYQIAVLKQVQAADKAEQQRIKAAIQAAESRRTQLPTSQIIDLILQLF